MRGLLVGRFQPFHAGHVAVVRHLRSHRPEETLILGIGSAEESYTLANPFTAAERHEMIARALDAEKVTGWVTIPIPDIHRHALWVAHVVELLPPFERVYTNNPLTRTLFEGAGFDVESPPVFERERLEGTAIRRLMREPGDAWADRLPAPVAAYLRELKAGDRLRTLAPANGG